MVDHGDCREGLGCDAAASVVSVDVTRVLRHGGLLSVATSAHLLLVNGFAVMSIFNSVDWLILDWLIFCTITPAFLVIPGTEGSPGYKNYVFHFRGFLIGTGLSATIGLIIAGALQFIR